MMTCVKQYPDVIQTLSGFALCISKFVFCLYFHRYLSWLSQQKVNDLRLSAFNAEHDHSSRIDLVTVFDAILTSRQTCEKLHENIISNIFRKTALLKKISIVN